MKTTKRILAMVLAVIMVMSLATTAFAAETTGTIENGTSRTYKAYQIFSGTQASTSAVLGDIAWGSGINSAEFLAALKTLVVADATPFASCETADDVANVLKNEANSSAIAKAFANLAENYVTGDGTTIGSKKTVTVPSGYYIVIDQTAVDGQDKVRNAALLQVTNGSSMKITEKNTTPTVEKKVNKTDVNIGDTVTFTLTATMPSKIEGYEAYKVVFHDTMSAGLAFNKITSVKVGTKTLTTSQYTLGNKVNEDGTTTLTITIDDVLALGATTSTKIVVTYTATVDKDAVIGTEGNPNEVYLEYSNDPQSDGTGKTPEKEVIVYTWKMPVFKYTGTDTPLAGAGFTLYADEACTMGIELELKDGTTNVYLHKKTNTAAAAGTEIVTDATGKFEIHGLAQGTYYLKETTVPAGYNSLNAPIKVVIGENGALTQDGADATEIQIQNNAGATLPETGGMGTTMFYIFGAILMLGAAVLLVTKRRMNIAE